MGKDGPPGLQGSPPFQTLKRPWWVWEGTFWGQLGLERKGEKARNYSRGWAWGSCSREAAVEEGRDGSRLSSPGLCDSVSSGREGVWLSRRICFSSTYGHQARARSGNPRASSGPQNLGLSVVPRRSAVLMDTGMVPWKWENFHWSTTIVTSHSNIIWGQDPRSEEHHCSPASVLPTPRTCSDPLLPPRGWWAVVSPGPPNP